MNYLYPRAGYSQETYRQGWDMGVSPSVNQAFFTTIAITGFTVAFLHAAIPTHWLPFVLTARVQKWNRAKTLFITALAGSGHVLFTAILGFLVAWFGIALNDKIGGWFPWIAGGALVLFGLYYVFQQIRGNRHGHSHVFGGHSRTAPSYSSGGHDHSHPHEHEHSHGEHEHSHADHEHGHGEHGHSHLEQDDPHQDEELTPPPRKSDWGAIVSLLALLTFSPCEGFLPVYVSGVRYGWSGFFLLTIILSVATVAGMVVFTWLTLAGMEKLKLRVLEKYESGIMGALLCVLGILVIIFEK
jgi:nickel/cobalt transporter (NicO) family protein